MILFITRKYPPSVGGMQRLSYDLAQYLAQKGRLCLVKYGGSKLWLPFFWIYALLRGMWIVLRHPVEIVHIGDPVLAPIGRLLSWFGGVPATITVHGLDLLYSNPLYQTFFLSAIKDYDAVICISAYVEKLAVQRGVTAHNTVVIPVGIDGGRVMAEVSEEERERWLRRWELLPRPRFLLLTVGRLVPRKGVLPFVTEVLPRLAASRDDWAYLVIGEGPEKANIETAISVHGLERRVRMMGQVPDRDLNVAYALSDLFIMPNVPVADTAEGFGIVHLEARAAGLPVLASRLEGIEESFHDPGDGLLVPAGDWDAFFQKLSRLMNRGRTADETQVARRARQQRVRDRYGWERVGRLYLDLFNRLRRSPKGEVR